jgi:hypothetical protein
MSVTTMILLALCQGANPAPSSYFRITVVDAQTGRGVPLVELHTVHQLRFLTDSNGEVAFFEPGLMNQRVFFYVKGHGYELPKDMFGYRGVALNVTTGGSARLTIQRRNIAERLYRVTGAGIYRDSVLLGLPVPLQQPLLNGLVLGSDSVVNAVYGGKLYWFWGDTNRAAYPLGNFNATGAISDLPGQGGLDPDKGVDLHYLVDASGFARPVAPIPGPGPTWLSGPIVLRDQHGKERLFAPYVKISPDKDLEVYERGLAEFDDTGKQFVKRVTFQGDDIALHPIGHSFVHAVAGKPYIYFASPYPLLRIPASPEALLKPASYEGFTPARPNSPPKQLQLNRTTDGRLHYQWRAGAPVFGTKEQSDLVKSGQMKPEEGLLALRDVETDKPITAHAGSVSWNPYRGRWVMITAQVDGTSFLGETWFAEADTPVGPWVYARKIVTHDKYSFYNPKEHPYFAKEQGRILFFEGTYATTFSGNPDPTPWYDYNQIMYKLDLADQRVVLPVPVYTEDGEAGSRFGTVRAEWLKSAKRRIAFFALDRPRTKSIPVYERPDSGGLQISKPVVPPGARSAVPLFYALPVDAKERPASAIPLYEFIHADGKRRAYSTEASWTAASFHQTKEPLCLVWRNPIRAEVDWDGN